MDKKLRDVLGRALAPCPYYDEVCRHHNIVWQPEKGHVPRGYGGATGRLSEVSLILVTAEPGDPATDEMYCGSPDDMINEHVRNFESYILGDIRRGSYQPPFHRNLREIVELCWPDLDDGERWRRTWYTNTVLCSASVSGGPIAPSVEKLCCNNFFERQRTLMPTAFLIALGGKARKRLRSYDAHAQHPSARGNTRPRESWSEAALLFRKWFEQHPRN